MKIFYRQNIYLSYSKTTNLNSTLHHYRFVFFRTVAKFSICVCKKQVIEIQHYVAKCKFSFATFQLIRTHQYDAGGHVLH